MVVSVNNEAVRRALGLGTVHTVVTLDGEHVGNRCIRFDAEAGWVELDVENENGALIYDRELGRVPTEYRTGRIRAWNGSYERESR